MRERGHGLLAIAACLLTAAPALAQDPAPLTRADENRIISVRVGQVLTIELRQTAGTGSSWHMVPAKGLLAVSGSVVSPVRRDGPPIVGGPETVRFQVRVTAGGELALTFVNARSFGGPDPRAETATFIVEGR